MYQLRPPRVFVHKRVYENPQALARLERMLEGLGNPPFDEVDVADTDEVIEASGAHEDIQIRSGRARMGVDPPAEDPIFLFNTYVWDPAANASS